jgi:hypothetical protein
LPGGKKPRASNYHDLEKAREGAQKSRRLRWPQAARNTGPVIRIAKGAKVIMAALLTE